MAGRMEDTQHLSWANLGLSFYHPPQGAWTCMSNNMNVVDTQIDTWVLHKIILPFYLPPISFT